MSTSAHTPGPWEIDYETRPAKVCCVYGLPQYGEEKQGFAYVRGAIGYWDADENENLANIRLIAAAPDLLRACRNLVAVINDGISDPEDIDLYQQARVIIAKATGRL